MNNPHIDPHSLLKAYEGKLAEQSWESVAEFIHDDAVFIFSEGTFRGKAQIAAAFQKTFNLIEDEQYRIDNLQWLAETLDMAACIYDFHWQGIIDGQEMSGGGRGTSILQKIEGRWWIIHEHLGPHPR